MCKSGVVRPTTAPFSVSTVTLPAHTKTRATAPSQRPTARNKQQPAKTTHAPVIHENILSPAAAATASAAASTHTATEVAPRGLLRPGMLMLLLPASLMAHPAIVTYVDKNFDAPLFET